MTKVPRQDEFQRKGEAFESPKEFKPRKKKENRMAESYDTREMKTETEERRIQIRGTGVLTGASNPDFWGKRRTKTRVPGLNQYRDRPG